MAGHPQSYLAQLAGSSATANSAISLLHDCLVPQTGSTLPPGHRRCGVGVVESWEPAVEISNSSL